jgi:hypothetical protein
MSRYTLSVGLAIPLDVDDKGAPAIHRFADWCAQPMNAPHMFRALYSEWVDRTEDPDGIAWRRAAFPDPFLGACPECDHPAHQGRYCGASHPDRRIVNPCACRGGK